MRTETRRVELSGRLTAVFVIDGGGIRTEFLPFLPSRFTESEASRYREGRREALDVLAAAIAPAPIPGAAA